MFLNVEKFLEKYHRDRMPYFKVYKGQSISEKHCMERLTEKPEDANSVDELLAVGAEKLQSFFDSFDDGNVTVVCKSAPKNESGNASNVRWGDGKNSSDMTKQSVGSSGGGGYISPQRQMKDMLEMMALMKGIFGMGERDNSQQELFRIQLEMAEKQRKADLKALKEQFEYQKRFEEYEAALQGEPPSWTETLAQEAIGLIKPLASTWMAKQQMGALPQAPAQLPVVNGMEAVAKPKKAKVAGSPQPPQHPMMNMSMDRTLVCIRQIMEQVFPDYNVNEVMPALANVSVQHRDIIRQFVLPTIEANRQAATAPKRPAQHNEEEE